MTGGAVHFVGVIERRDRAGSIGGCTGLIVRSRREIQRSGIRLPSTPEMSLTPTEPELFSAPSLPSRSVPNHFLHFLLAMQYLGMPCALESSKAHQRLRWTQVRVGMLLAKLRVGP